MKMVICPMCHAVADIGNFIEDGEGGYEVLCPSCSCMIPRDRLITAEKLAKQGEEKKAEPKKAKKAKPREEFRKVWVRMGGYLTMTEKQYKAFDVAGALKDHGFEVDGETYLPNEDGEDEECTDISDIKLVVK